MSGQAQKDGALPNLGDALRREHPTLDEALRRYRERREGYDNLLRPGKKRSGAYRSQRGVRREYRV